MTTITASVVNKLRQMTGAGMMDCKKALQESNGDMDGAVDILRKKGAAKAAKSYCVGFIIHHSKTQDYSGSIKVISTFSDNLYSKFYI